MLKKHARIFLCMLLILGVLASVSGCGGAAGQAGSNNAGKEVKLSFWVGPTFVSPDQQKLPQEEWFLSQLIKRFEAANPGIKVEITLEADELQTHQSFKAAAMAKNGPDIVQLWSGMTFLGVKEACLPLNNYIPKEDRENIRGWEAVSESLDALKTIYAYPWPGLSSAFVGYNKKLIAEAGLDFDKNPPRTVDEFMAALEKIKSKGILPIASDETAPALLYFMCNYWWLQETGHADILAKAEGKAKYADDKGFINTMKIYRSLYEKGYVNTDAATSTDSKSKFMQGKSALFITGNWDIDSLKQVLKDDFGIMLPPNINNNVALKDKNIGGVGASLAVANYTKYPTESVKFISHVLSKKEILEFYKTNPYIPIRKDITIEDLGWQNDSVLKKIFEWRDICLLWPDNCMTPDAGSEFMKLANLVLVGKMTPEDFAAKLDEAGAK